MAYVFGAKFRIGSENIVERKEALVAENRVKRLDAVPLAEHETIPTVPLGILGIQPHMIKENAGHKLHSRQRAAWVPAAGIGRHSDNVTTHLPADFGKFSRIHEKPPFNIILKIWYIIWLAKSSFGSTWIYRAKRRGERLKSAGHSSIFPLILICDKGFAFAAIRSDSLSICV